jgi:hypothetical protein
MIPKHAALCRVGCAAGDDHLCVIGSDGKEWDYFSVQEPIDLRGPYSWVRPDQRKR